MLGSPIHIKAQDTAKKLIDVNKLKVVQKINASLDSNQKKINGAVNSNIKNINDKAKAVVKGMSEKVVVYEEERPLPYEKLLNKKYTLSRRAYQNTVSQFNYLFNAEEDLKNIIQKAREIFQEDYTNLLSFYDYDLTNTSKYSIDSIIYRCNANIVLHDLRSNYVDDAYLLLSKAYLFHKNFDTAASILQFINYSFDQKENGMDQVIGSNLRKTNGKFSIATAENNRFFENVNIRNESLVWQARTYFETNELNEGISLLQLLKADALFPKRLKPFLSEQLAYGYYLSESYENAAKYLIDALDNAPDETSKSRWQFLIAQLWQKVDNIKNAYTWYKKANESSINPIIGVYAKINMIRIEAKNADISWEKLAEELERMLKREKYKPYADIVYFEMAKLAIQNKAFEKANLWLVKSIKNNNTNNKQKEKSFELLGDINYKNDQLGIARMAYDSIGNVVKTNPQYDIIIARKKWIAPIQKNIEIIETEDTLQYIYQLPIDLQKEVAKRWEKRTKLKQENLKNLFTDKVGQKNIYNDEIAPTPVVAQNNNNSNSSFYFDNKNTITQGKQNFKQKWGDRPNVDAWRRKTSATMAYASIKSTTTSTNEVNNLINKSKLNTDTAKKDSATFTLIADAIAFAKSKQEWNKNILQVAQTLLFQLNDFDKALPYYKRLINNNIDSVITERALLDLASQYIHDNKKESADSIIKIVESQFPKGSYLSKKNAQLSAKKKENEVVNEYKTAYFLSRIGNWDSLYKLTPSYTNDFKRTKWQTPFQFIKVKMYAQLGKDSIALVLLDSIILVNKTEFIREKAKNIITEIKNRKNTEDYLQSLTFTKQETITDPFVTDTISPNNTIANTNIQQPIKNTDSSINTSISNNTNIKVANSIPTLNFNLDTLEQHYIALVTTDIKPNFVKEIQNAFVGLNEDDFSKLKLSVSNIPLSAKTYIVWIGPFDQSIVAKNYLSKVKPRLKTEIISFIPTKQYELYVVGKSNIELIKSEDDLKIYKEFMINKIYKP